MHDMNGDQGRPEAADASGIVARLRGNRVTIVQWIFIVIVVIPTTLAMLYSLITTAPLYESQAQFSVEDRQQTGGGGSLGGMLASFGIASGNEPSAIYALEHFLQSDDALRELEASYGFRRYYRAPNGDSVLRLAADANEDQVLRYYLSRVNVRISVSENILTLNVDAFDPKVAQGITGRLLVICENFINRMGNRALEGQVAFREQQLAIAQDRLRQAHGAVADWRHRNGVVDPTSQAKLVEGVIAGLEVELAKARADLSQMSMGDNAERFAPRIKALRQREASLQQQVDASRAQLSGRSMTTVASQLADYERLEGDVDFAAKNLEMAMGTLNSARQDALQKHKYLVRIAGPSLPSERSFPLPIFHTFIVLVASLLIYGVSVLLYSILRDYRSV